VLTRFIPGPLAGKITAGDELDHGPSTRKETAGKARFFGTGHEMLAAD
jgi:hypothetical protein